MKPEAWNAVEAFLKSANSVRLAQTILDEAECSLEAAETALKDALSPLEVRQTLVLNLPGDRALTCYCDEYYNVSFSICEAHTMPEQ